MDEIIGRANYVVDTNYFDMRESSSFVERGCGRRNTAS